MAAELDLSGSAGSGVAVRAFDEADAPAIERISREAGPPEAGSGADVDYLRHLVAQGVVAVAQSSTGDVIGWGAVTGTAHGQILSDLFVDSRVRGAGVGAAILNHLWPQGSSGAGRFTFSSRHPNALPLYVRAGLVPAWPLLYLSGDRTHLPEPSLPVHVVDPADAAAAEAGFTGVDRGPAYAYWGKTDGAHGFVVQVGPDAVAAGVTHPDDVVHVAVALGQDATGALLCALSLTRSSTATVCLPGPHPGLIRLLRHGFQVLDHDLHLASADVTLPTTWVYSPGLA